MAILQKRDLAIIPFGSRHYGDWMAAVELHQAKLLAERYDDTGNLIRVFRAVDDYGESFLENPSYKRNPSISIGREFFSAAVKDYDEWREKWWREAIQNSVDAGAASVICVEEELPENMTRITILDDGKGMDEDTIINKFLVLGASGKTGEGSVGGFGKAKELLILPWIGWAVESKNTMIIGQNISYDIKKSSRGVTGTRLSVVMSNDQKTAVRYAEQYINKCYLPNVKFSLLGPAPTLQAETAPKKQWERELFPNIHPGREVDRIGTKAVIYYKDPTEESKDAKNGYANVRVNGLHMFDMWLHDGIHGRLTVELLGDTKLLLTANRDGFKDAELKSELNTIFKELMLTSERKYRDQSGMIKKKYKGRGKFSTKKEEQFKAVLMKRLFGKGTPLRETEGNELVFINSDAITKDVNEILQPTQPETELPPSAQDDEVGFSVDLTLPEDVVQALVSIQFSGPTHIENTAKLMAWQPDYFLWNEIAGYKVLRYFLPEYMSPKVMKILRLWTELCRFILIQLQSKMTFGVGFMFSTDTAGAFHDDREEDDKWLLLNPFVPTDYNTLTERGDYHRTRINPEIDPMYDLSDPRMISLMYAVAVHECTHMADAISYHDESFSTALTYNVAKTSGMDRQIRQIVKAVKKRR